MPKQKLQVVFYIKRLERGKKAVKTAVFQGKNKVFATLFSPDPSQVLLGIDKFLQASKIGITNLNHFKTEAPGEENSLLCRQLDVLARVIAFLNTSQ